MRQGVENRRKRAEPRSKWPSHLKSVVVLLLVGVPVRIALALLLRNLPGELLDLSLAPVVGTSFELLPPAFLIEESPIAFTPHFKPPLQFHHVESAHAGHGVSAGHGSCTIDCASGEQLVEEGYSIACAS